MGVMRDKYGFDIYNDKDLSLLESMFFDELDLFLSLSQSSNDFVKEDFVKVMYVFYMLGIDLLEEGCILLDEYDGSYILDLFRENYSYEKDYELYVYIKFLMIYEFYNSLYEYKNYQINDEYTALNEIFDDTADLPPSPLRTLINEIWLDISSKPLHFWDSCMDLIDHSFAYLYDALDYFYEHHLIHYEEDSRSKLLIDMINFTLDIDSLDAMLCRYTQSANFSETEGFHLSYGDPLPELDDDCSSYFYEKLYAIFKY